MRQPDISDYRSRPKRCKHFCVVQAASLLFRLLPVGVGERNFAYLTVITAALLLLVGCSGTKPQADAIKPPAAEVKSGTAESSLPAKTSPTGGWQSLFDGKSLRGWAITDFAGRGEVKAQNGTIVLGQGVMTGVTWTNPYPKMNYEIALDAMRVEGSDFFCGLTFPVGEDPCSLIVGGWGGGVVGLSSLDGEDAANNETTKVMEFERRRWYAIRVRVEPKKIQAWIDDEKLVDVDTTDRRISIRVEVEASRPLGIASWSTAAALRNIRVRRLPQ